MKYIKYFLTCLLLNSAFLFSTEFTISSYNCGGLSEHYDYLRAASMEKLMQERYLAEPVQMALNEKIQTVALKILFTSNQLEGDQAQEEWDRNNYQHHFQHLTAAPIERRSPNKLWNQKAEEMITSYQVRPVEIRDDQVKQRIEEHLNSLVMHPSSNLLQEGRAAMAKTLFAQHLNQDIICLQEATYLTPSMFPENYEVLFASSSHSINGIAWNKERFEWVQTIGDIRGKAFAVLLRDNETDKTLLVASGHISGCNPYNVERDFTTGVSDSDKGDAELQTLVNLFENIEADFKLIGMDSNVTALHPRLKILKEAGYTLDYLNFLEPTCTNPYQVLNTRIDWILLKSPSVESSIANLPIAHVGLNTIHNNMSDHKPVAAKITY